MNKFLFSIPIAITTLTNVPTECKPITIKSNSLYKSEWSALIKHKNDVGTNQYLIKTDPYLEILRRINSLGELTPNWDGHGAIVPDPLVINNVKGFIKSLPESIVPDLQTDDLVATPYGTIVIDFKPKVELVSVEIGEKEIGFFSEFADGNDLSMVGTLFNQDALPPKLLVALNKLYKEDIV
jgi:hypothetical protein